MKAKSFLICLISLLSLNLTAQETSPLIPDTPPSPQAVAFNRLGNYEINNNYGVPDISIPLFDIDFHGFKIPLALHYEANPIRPGYNYDVTGLGWTLSGNSCVSRTIKDRADEDGAFSNPFELDPFTYSNGEERIYLDYVYNNWLDDVNYKYDSYNVTLPSGRNIPFYMYKDNGTMIYHLLAQDCNVKISCNYVTMDSFSVIDENGVTYNFTEPEKASNIFLNDRVAQRNVTWLLTSIDIPSKGRITYSYTENPVEIETHNIFNEPVITVKRFYDRWGEWTNGKRFDIENPTISQNPVYRMKFLKKIHYDSTDINFNYIDDGKHMGEVTVSDQNSLIRKFKFSFDRTSSLWFLNSLEITGQNDDDKLVYSFLYSNSHPGNGTDYWGNIGISITNDDYSSSNFQCSCGLGNFNMFFGYDGIEWAWDELKSRVNNSGGLVRLIENSGDDHGYYYKLKLQTYTDGDARIPSSPNMHGVLQRITYPNGGFTVFNYENHRFPTATATDGDIVLDRRNQRIIEGGGFRIESILNFSADGNVINEDYYRYGFTLGDIVQRNFPIPLTDSVSIAAIACNDTINHHIGCGEAVVDPNLFTFLNDFAYSRMANQGSHSYSYGSPKEFRDMLLGKDSRFKLIGNTQGMPAWWEATFSANKFRSLIGGRRPVVYPEVTVYHGNPYEPDQCKSKTVYKYDIYKHDYPQHIIQSNYLANFNTTEGMEADTAYFEPLYFETDYPALATLEYPADRHLLRSKYDYSFNADSCRWERVCQEKYSYINHYMNIHGFTFESCISRENYYPNTEGLTYHQIGFYHPLSGVALRLFYKDCIQYLGKAELCDKSTTFFRQNRAPSIENTITEHYEYKYPDAMSKNMSYSFLNTKGVANTFIGDEEEDGDTIIAEMKSRNMLASVVSSTTYTDINNDTPFAISGDKIEYKSYGNAILPYKIYEYNQRDRWYSEENPIDSCEYEESIEVISYDAYSNPTEIVDLKTGLHTVFLWGSYGRYMTAMIQNATMQEVEEASSSLTEYSTSIQRHTTLQEALPNCMIQTWDYKPLIGVTSHTDVNGMTLSYEYDGLGRLKSVSRYAHNGTNPETIKEYEYNFVNQ